MIDSFKKNDSLKLNERLLPPFQASLVRANAQDVTPFPQCVLHLYRILANQALFASHHDVMRALLDVGCARFHCDTAFVLRRISEQVYEIQGWRCDEPLYFVGQHISAAKFPCIRLHDENRVVIEADLTPSATNARGLAYNLSESRSYVGISLDLNSSERGVVCFLSGEAMPHEADSDDISLLELMAEGIACMTELQKARAQRKTEDLAIFASGSIKSLEEYQMAAELPEGLGISGKVVEVLKRRIGQASLSIDNIAEELNLSKRTLQRRLQQQGISFAELRDKVRFHYSIDYLVKQQISIDRISSTLDFSDRTSFTNAFKRWTGLSPSTFRKVFRDYA